MAEKKENIISEITIPRWRPDFRYRSDKLEDVTLKNFKSLEPSITDKEAFRVTLASLRGSLAQGVGRPDVGSYSIPAGKEYDSRFDFSFLNRPDLTIVDLDEAIKNMRKTLESYDEDLSIEIKAQLAEAEKKLETMKKEELVNKKAESSDE